MGDKRSGRPDPFLSKSEVPESEFIERMQAGDASALDSLLEQYWIPLVTYAVRLLGSWDVAEDVAQETFVRIWERREEWKLEGSVRALLYRITRNLALDERKRRDRRAAWINHRRREASRVAIPSEHLQGTELEAAFERAVAALPERRREVFRLARLHGLSYKQIGEVMGIASQTVANQLSAALADLRDALEPFLDEPTPSASPSIRRAEPDR